MGLDVFEVRTGFLGRPQGAAYRFAWHLAAEEDSESWEVWSDGNCSGILTLRRPVLHDSVLRLFEVQRPSIGMWLAVSR